MARTVKIKKKKKRKGREKWREEGEAVIPCVVPITNVYKTGGSRPEWS